ncbi:DUF4917 family protein [Microbacterium sp. APC 3901]|uniref:DUF4917 family protein n=1 Tax=Microbacterium sp. APC 3901 TaxID=3035192 RepID=UPI0025B41BDA|nr:DUF4917 family protein [Microbacterium sp. APC 3901]MDN3443403.1 DUF4917 family protein [Microbacterium sp. APC 3901]
MPPRILSFDEALLDARRKSSQRSILLGNGFSIGYNPSIFSYDSLADEAELAGLSVAKPALFDALKSSNFEAVIDKLNASSSLLTLYNGDRELAATMAADAIVVRNGLADVLANRHPVNAQGLSDEEVLHARTFLSNFRQFYTLSYDLLLYWVVTRTGVGPYVHMRDGFEWPAWNDRSALIWKSKPTQGRQRVFFLHGALHLFIRGKKLEKLSYREHGSLVGELRSRLDDDNYPLVVTEGSRPEKEARIERSGYLRFGLRRFAATEGALFIHGVSMNPNDDHILELIESDSSRVSAIYVGVHGDPASPDNRRLIERAKEMKNHRRTVGGEALRVRFYDSDSARVWRG